MVKGKAALVLGFALAATFGVIFLSPVVGAVNDNTGTQSVVNETVTANTGTYVDLGGYDINSGSETVYGFNDTSGSYEVASSPGDYEMDYDSGAIKANSSSTLINDSEDIKVSYDYQAAGPLATTVIEFVPVMMGTLILFVVGRGVQRQVG